MRALPDRLSHTVPCRSSNTDLNISLAHLRQGYAPDQFHEGAPTAQHNSGGEGGKGRGWIGFRHYSCTLDVSTGVTFSSPVVISHHVVILTIICSLTARTIFHTWETEAAHDLRAASAL